MRLDKYLANTGELSRSEAKAAVRSGRVLVNGSQPKSADMNIDPKSDTVTLDGVGVEYSEFVYIMLNKPAGVVSATEDGRDRTVLDLLPEKYAKLGLFPCGRLDKDTVGLIIMTNNGALAHDLLSPKKHVEKEYFFKTEKTLDTDSIKRLEAGVHIGKDIITKPCSVRKLSDSEAVITLTEGKYHQIKLMLEAVGNRVTYLKRISFGGIPLDSSLSESDWRMLTDDEINKLSSRS